MSAEGPPISFFPTSKRSACDRCRKQKLRCPPRDNATQSCLRCVRGSFPCTTGYTKPLGRSGGDGGAASSHNGAEPPADLIDEMAGRVLEGLDMRLLEPESSPSTAITFGSADSWTLSTPDNDDQPPGQIWSQTLTQDKDSPNFFGSYNHDSLLTNNGLSSTAPLSNIENRNNTLFDDFNRVFSAPTPSELDRGEQIPYATSITGQQNRTLSSSGENVLSGAERDVRLSQLSLDLSRQMQECETKAQHGNTASKDDAPSRNPFDTTIKSSADQSASQPYGDALRSTSEFLEILLCYDNGNTSATAVSLTQRQSAISDVSNAPVNFTYVLNLVSCYLRIIGIFDSLLRQLHELQCRKGITPPDYGVVVAGLQILPDLHLAGFPVEQGSLQTKILIQAIEHQFELIERSLGLPVELRVSDRREDYHSGLLQNEWARSLMQAILRGQRGGEEADVVIFDQIPTVDSLESLKVTMVVLRRNLSGYLDQ